MKRLFACTLMLFAAAPSLAADVNGYTAQYECRAGGPNCNVDVDNYVVQACNQTITTADSAATISNKINGGSQYICIENGDYTGKGTITITASGTSGARKVLRYSRSGDTDDEPWNQSSGNKVTIDALFLDGADYWIIHRLNLGHTGGSTRTEIQNSANNNILNRLHFQRNIGINSGSAGTTVQNSVFEDERTKYGASQYAVSIDTDGANNRIVNNEIADIRGHSFQLFHGSGPVGGVVLENNDIYSSSALFTNCSGTYTPSNPDSACSASEMSVSIKKSGTEANPTRIIHNRMWGARRTDTSVCCDGGGEGGGLINLQDDGNGAKWILIQNNILMDAQSGVETYGTGSGGDYPVAQVSFIGNISYRIHKFHSGFNSYTFWDDKSETEIYLNTMIDNNYAWIHRGGTNNDYRCNVAISSAQASGSLGSGGQQDYNAYYDTTDNGETNKGTETVSTRANSTAYSLNTIIRTAAASSCVNGTESACFLYKVETSGTTDGTASPYCKSLGCLVTDGTVQLRAIRGPYTFYRKLRTSPEPYTIPYARAYLNATNPSAKAPEAVACPSNYAAKNGIGINDVN